MKIVLDKLLEQRRRLYYFFCYTVLKKTGHNVSWSPLHAKKITFLKDFEITVSSL